MVKIMSSRGNILMYTPWYIGSPTNLANKFRGQIEAFEQLGYNCYYLQYDNSNVYFLHKQEKENLISTYYHKDKHFMVTNISKGFYIATQKTQFTYSYCRGLPFGVWGVKALKNLYLNSCHIIIEEPTYPKEKERAAFKLPIKLALRYNDLIHSVSRDYISLYTLIGEQFTDKRYYGKKAINIINGICVDNMKEHVYTRYDNNLHVIAVASMAHWHGYDRFIRGLALNKTCNVQLHLVGNSADGSLEQWENMSIDLGVKDKVVIHGALYNKELDELFDECEIACDSLGCYRTGVYSFYSLKSREYMARGIPFITSNSFDNESAIPPFCYIVPNDDSPINIPKLIEFSHSICQCHNIASLMRSYAREHFGWENIMARVLREAQ